MYEMAVVERASRRLAHRRSGRQTAKVPLLNTGKSSNPVAIAPANRLKPTTAVMADTCRSDVPKRIKSSPSSELAFSCKHSSDELFDGNLLDLLLSALVPEGEREAICRCLLDEFGSFAEVVSAPPVRLEQFLAGFEHAVAFLKGLEVVAQRLAQRDIRRRLVLSDTKALIRYARVVLGRAAVRQNRVLYLNDALELTADEPHRHGTVNHAPIYPREVIKLALGHDATGVVLVQNDPSGRCQPSASDIKMTKHLEESLRAIGISLYDHIVVSPYEHLSFRECGLL